MVRLEIGMHIRYLKDERDYWYIGEDKITKENFKKYLEKSKFSVASNGVLYRTDKVGCIPDILDTWFSQRVEFKNKMKEYGNSGEKQKYDVGTKKSVGTEDSTSNSLYGVLASPSL